MFFKTVMIKYPTITDATLVPFRALEIQLKGNLDLFDRAECPYPPAVKLFLKRALSPGGGAVVTGTAVYSDDEAVQEVTDLYRELKRVAFVGTQVSSGDSKDQVDILKKASDLFGKLIDLRSKAITVRDMGKFQQAVIQMLEKVVTPSQRSEFIEIMGKYNVV